MAFVCNAVNSVILEMAPCGCRHLVYLIPLRCGPVRRACCTGHSEWTKPSKHHSIWIALQWEVDVCALRHRA